MLNTAQIQDIREVVARLGQLKAALPYVRFSVDGCGTQILCEDKKGSVFVLANIAHGSDKLQRIAAELLHGLLSLSLDALEAALADSERLDWLERRSYNFESSQALTAGMVEFDDYRAAIDAARNSSAPGRNF